MNRRTLTIFVMGIGILFVLFPNNVSQGAKMGLNLWFYTVLPALLPFMIFSDFLVRKNITEYISNAVYPIFSRILGLSHAGCYPAVIGLLSGYPLGAKTTAMLYEKKIISRNEAKYLLTFCNNASPMFLLEYMGLGCMGLKYPAVIPVLVYLSAFLGTFLSGLRPGRYMGYDSEKEEKQKEEISVMTAVDESILGSFITLTKVGGYIILFSILAKIVEDICPVSSNIKYLLTGFLEITTGGEMIARGNMNPVWKKIVLTALTAFGGLSSVAQTASVLNGTDLSTVWYLKAKIKQMGIAFFVAVLLFGVIGK